jgi:hypothetical protein
MTTVDFSRRPLGKLPFAPKAKDLKLSSYVADKGRLIESAQVPAASNWSAMPAWTGAPQTPDADPLGNDRAGDCVFAGPGHMVRMIGQLTGKALSPTSADVLEAYSRYTGYDPATGENDNGFRVREMLGIWQREGLFGTKAVAYALVGNDPDEKAIASWLGCGLIGGYSLPLSAQTQVDATGRQLWYVPVGGFPSGQGPGSWGGHCIWSDAPSPSLDGGNSWGEQTYWTQEWDRACCDERWVVLVDAWVDAIGRAPNGFAIEDLLADVRARTA